MLSNVTSVFSRYFVVGFFLPPFFGLVLLWQTLSGPFPPNRLKYGYAGDIGVIGAGALLVALILSGSYAPILSFLEGDVQAGPLRLVFGRLFKLWRRKELDRRRELSANLETATRSVQTLEAGQSLFADASGAASEQLTKQLADARADRARAERLLTRYFPGGDRDLVATRLGNTVQAWQSRVYERWALDPYAIGAHVKQLLTEQERDRHDEVETNAAFWTNSAIVAALVAVAYCADSIAYRHWYEAWWVVVAYLAYVFYRMAVGWAARSGDEISASIDLHRFDLYSRFGLREPRTRKAELEFGEAINAVVLKGGTIRDLSRRS